MIIWKFHYQDDELVLHVEDKENGVVYICAINMETADITVRVAKNRKVHPARNNLKTILRKMIFGTGV